jgi:hypothetical protein
MAEVQKMRGEKIYECDFNITGVTDYDVTLDALEKVPLQGARIDVAGRYQRPHHGQST